MSKEERPATVIHILENGYKKEEDNNLFYKKGDRTLMNDYLDGTFIPCFFAKRNGKEFKISTVKDFDKFEQYCDENPKTD